MSKEDFKPAIKKLRSSDSAADIKEAVDGLETIALELRASSPLADLATDLSKGLLKMESSVFARAGKRGGNVANEGRAEIRDRWQRDAEVYWKRNPGASKNQTAKAILPRPRQNSRR